MTQKTFKKQLMNNFLQTYNTDYQVADSAGTATAIFSGSKTRMAVLGIDSTPAYNTCDAQVNIMF
jgi:alkaline phosphatase